MIKTKIKNIILKGVPAWLFISLALPWLQLYFTGRFSSTQFLARLFPAMLLVLALTLTTGMIKKKKWSIILQTVVIGIYAIISNLEYFMFCCQNESFNDSFFIHLSYYEISNGFSSFSGIAIYAIFYFLISVALSFVPLNVLPRKVQKKYTPIAWIVLAVFLIIGENPLKNFCLKSYDVYIVPRLEKAERYVPLSELQEAGIKVGTDSNKISAEPGKNLVLIFWESMSRAYLNKEAFPELMPHTEKMIKDGLDFPNMEPTLNALNTLAGAYSTMTGVPFFFTQKPSEYVHSDAVNIHLSFPDILHKAGYLQVAMFGGAGRFANIGVLFKKNSYDQVFSKVELSKWPGKKEFSKWGLQDYILFRHALIKYNEMAASGKPFNLTLMTLDTHGGSGFPTGRTEKYKKIPDNSILNAVHEADINIYNFISQIKQSPAWKNTVVWVIADHPVGYCIAEQYMQKAEQRKMICFCINSGETRVISIPTQSADLAPTILASLKVKHNYTFPNRREFAW